MALVWFGFTVTANWYSVLKQFLLFKKHLIWEKHKSKVIMITMN